MMRMLLLVLGTAFLAVSGGVAFMIWGELGHVREPKVIIAPQQETVATSKREMTLYFASPDFSYLMPQVREVAADPGGGDEAWVRALVDAIFSGAQGLLLSLWPQSAGILELRIQEETVTLSLTPDTCRSHSTGSRSEILSVYSLANSIAANFPYLRKLHLQCAGHEIDSLKGHMDLRQAVAADFSWTQPPQELLESAAPPDKKEVEKEFGSISRRTWEELE